MALLALPLQYKEIKRMLLFLAAWILHAPDEVEGAQSGMTILLTNQYLPSFCGDLDNLLEYFPRNDSDNHMF